MISFFPSGNIVTTHKPLVYSVHSDPGRYALLALAGKMLQTKSERERERERRRVTDDSLSLGNNRTGPLKGPFCRHDMQSNGFL